MVEPTIANKEVADIDLLVEIDGRILDQIRKDLSQEYVRLMSRALQASLRTQASDGAMQATTGSGEKSV